MDQIATLEGLNFLQAQQAAATLGGRRSGGMAGVEYIQAQQLVTYPRKRGLGGCIGCGVSGFGDAPAFQANASAASKIEAARATICRENTQAEVAKRDAVTLDAQAKTAAKNGDADGAALLKQEAARKAQESVAASEKAAKAALVAKAAVREKSLFDAAREAAARGKAAAAAAFSAAAQKAREQGAEAAAAKNTAALACKCGSSGGLGGLGGLFSRGAPARPSGGTATGAGSAVARTMKACAGQDIKACIEARRAAIKEEAATVDKANQEVLPVTKAGLLGDLPTLVAPFAVFGVIALLIMRAK